jgi:hypothetical protein
MMLRVMWIAALAACGGSAGQPAQPVVHVVADAAVPDAAPLDQDLPRLIQRTLMLFDDIARAFAASGTDCAAATARLDALAGYRDVPIANAKVFHDRRSDELRQALAPHTDQLERATQAFMQSPTMASCVGDARFVKALDVLLVPPPGS